MSSISNTAHFLSPFRLVKLIFNFFYGILQSLIILVFKPPTPKSPEHPAKPFGRIAVIGAGLTGVSSAAHAIAHNFDVVIYEKSDSVGGIWSHVNATSGLQLNSFLYRFHPGVRWSCTFPKRDEILSEITRIWKEYQLEPRTRFNTPVTKITRADSSGEPKKLGHARWLVNNDPDVFDAVIVNIGTCGDPKMVHIDGMPDENGTSNDDGEGETKKESEIFAGKIVHSSELDDLDMDGKDVVVIGSGASGVEAIELAIEKGAQSTTILARDDKWIIPRNIFFDTTLAAQPFGRQMPLSFIYEWILKTFHYGSLKRLAPAHRGVFEGTPIVNDEFLPHIKQGRCTYLRADTKRLTASGVLITDRTSKRESKPGDEGEEKEVKADIVVMATGFTQPSIDFLPEDLFPEDYQRPNLYLQNFSTEDWSVLLTNSAYVNAIGTVGHFHIGIYTRVLLTLLLDEEARPTPKDMKLWVDALRFVKRGTRGGALSFFTYMELTIWLFLFHLFKPDRIRWMLFIMQGWGVYGESGHVKILKET